uniref:WAP domain-containing protein n=1 Tax=Cricetulus griseus TaxID=10029 RepID=A0A8C2LII1_CRIGR
MLTVGLMNSSALQLLLLLGTLGQLVLAKWKDRVSSETQISDYILKRPILKPCLKHPTSTQCEENSCKIHLDCVDELHRCCQANCGNVCMGNHKISSVMSVVVP